jgi:predicted transposase/invertase (TIGR01784 family)
MEKSFISPLNDYVVKCIYGDQKNIANTRELLKPILGIPPEEYGKLTIREPFLKRRWKKDKLGLLDIRLTTTTGKSVDVEVQVERDKTMRQRIIYYLAKMVTEQMKAGFGFDKVRQTISVLIADHKVLPDDTDCGPAQYLNTFELRSKTGELFTDLQKVVILELPKVPNEDDGQAIWPYLRFFKCKTEEDINMLLKKHPEVQPVVEEYHRISWSKRRRWRAEYMENQRREAYSALETARDEVRAEKDQIIAEIIAEKDQALMEKDQSLMEKDRALMEKDRVIAELMRKMQDV